jgi:YHS domain-containing protein
MRFILLNVFRLIVLMLVVAAIRGLIGYAARAFGLTGASGGSSSHVSPAAQQGGKLEKDPVCGTFVSPSASVTKEVGGQLIHFCSKSCRDKYRG